MHLAIRVDASPNMGFGHLSRCNALADHALTAGWRVTIYSRFCLEDRCDPRVEFVHSDSEAVLSDIIQTAKPDWLLIDNYQLGGEASKVYAPLSCRKAFIDDLFSGCPAGIDLVVSPAGLSERQHLEGLYPDAELLLGYQYSMLSKSFRQARIPYEERNRTLVTFGGSDVAGLTVPVVKALVSAGVTDIDVVITDAMGDLDLALPSVTTHRNLGPIQMAKLQGQSALAVSAAGGTVFELACCGVPSAICVVADNQLKAASELRVIPGFELVDCRSKVDVGQIVASYNRLKIDSKRLSIHHAAVALVDGNGCSKIIEKMATMDNFRCGSVELSRVCADDLEQLRRWRNSPDVRAMMCDQSEISIAQQQRWFEKLGQSTSHHFVARYKRQPIGYVNLKPGTEAGSFEAGLYTGEPRYRGTIVSFLMAIAQLDFAFQRLQANRVEAKVKPENQAALRFNEMLGYQHHGEIDGMCLMTLSLSDYEQARIKLARFIR